MVLKPRVTDVFMAGNRIINKLVYFYLLFVAKIYSKNARKFIKAIQEELDSVFKDAISIMNIIKSRALDFQIFNAMCDEMES